MSSARFSKALYHATCNTGFTVPTISVRISNEEKKALGEYGPLSEAVREEVRLYLQAKKAGTALAKLRALQAKDRAKTTTLEESKLIKKDRNR